MKSIPKEISSDGADIGRWSPRGDGIYFRNEQSFFWIGLTRRSGPSFLGPRVLFIKEHRASLPPFTFDSIVLT